MTYANILTRLFDADSINQAIAGDVFNADNLDNGLDFNPDTVFVAYGTNDWRGGRDILATAEGYFKKLTEIYRGKKIFVILPIYRMDQEEYGENTKMPFSDFRALLRHIALRHKGIAVIDSWDFVPHRSDFFEDGFLHPNDLGFLLYAEALKEYLT